MAYGKPITIGSIAFEEESLPSGRKLLHLIFKQKFGTSHYKWTPPWKGNFGVEKLFFKALEIEEWNDYDGVWSKELRESSKEIPSLDEIRLPVKIRLGELTGPMKNQLDEDTYRLAIELISDERQPYKSVSGGKSSIGIGDVIIPWDSLKAFLLKIPTIRGVSKEVETATDWLVEDWNGAGFVDRELHDIGVRFYIWIKAGVEKSEYQVIGKELAANIRSFIRKHLSDYQALKRGFDEI